MDLAGIGQLLVGVSAVAVVVLNYLSARRQEKLALEHKKELGDVAKAANGMSEKLQALAEQAGYKAGHQAADDEAALRDRL